MTDLKRKMNELNGVLDKAHEKHMIQFWLVKDGVSTPFIIIEELAELIRALVDYIPDNEESFLNLEEEIADCQIALEFCRERYQMHNPPINIFDTHQTYKYPIVLRPLKSMTSEEISKSKENICKATVREFTDLIKAITKYDGRRNTFIRETLIRNVLTCEFILKSLITIYDIPENDLSKIRTLKLTQ